MRGHDERLYGVGSIDKSGAPHTAGRGGRGGARGGPEVGPMAALQTIPHS